MQLYRNPWLRLLDHAMLLPRNGKHRVWLRNGICVLVRAGTSDFRIIDEIFSLRVYERGLSYVRKGSQVIDIGAHCGIFSMAAAMRGADVVSVEPRADNFELLVENIRVNGFGGRVRAWNCAVVGPGRSAHRELYFIDGDTGGATFYPSVHAQWPAWSNPESWRTELVRCVTLDSALCDLGAASCDLVKLDCEGAEAEILLGATDETLGRIGAIVMECHAGVDSGRIRSRLEAAGFDVELRGSIGLAVSRRGAR